ncbi:L-fuculose phosphate aldolase, partial [Dysosmobacter welbionis]
GRRVRLDLLPAEVGQQGGESPVEAAVHHGKAPNPILAVHLAENQGLLLLIPRTGEDIGRPVQLSFQRQESPGQRLHGAALRRHRHHQPLQEARKAVQVHREYRGLPGLVHGDGALRRTGLVVKNKITVVGQLPRSVHAEAGHVRLAPRQGHRHGDSQLSASGQVRQFALLSLLQFHGIPSFLAYPFLRPAGLPPYFSGWRPPNQEVDPVFQPSGRRSIRPPQ